MKLLLYTICLCLISIANYALAIDIQDNQTLRDILHASDNYKFHLSANALYLKPNNIDTPKDEYSVFQIPVETQYQWGYQIKLNFFFKDNKDIYVEWIHYQNALDENDLLGQSISGEAQTIIHEGYHSDFDIINIDVGQWITLRNGFLLKLHAGIEYANLEVGYQFNYETVQAPQITHQYLKNYSYQLFGTRMGLNLDFILSHKLDLLVNSSALMLNRNGHHHYMNVATINPGGFLMNDVDVSSKLQGILYGTDIEAVLNYKLSISSSDLVFSGGARGIIFIEDFTKWSGAIIGMKWMGNI